MASLNTSKSEALNLELKSVVEEYCVGHQLNLADIGNDNMKFLYRCAAKNMSFEMVEQLYNAEGRDILEEIYDNTLEEKVVMNGEDMETRVTSQWTVIAAKFSSEFPKYMGLSMLLKTILEISKSADYAEYSSLLTQMLDSGKISIEDILLRRSELKAAGKNSISDDMYELIRDLPGFVDYLESEKEAEYIESNIAELNNTKKNLMEELSDLRRVISDEKEKYEENKKATEQQNNQLTIDNLIKENEQLKKELELSQAIKSHRKFFVSGKQRKYELVRLMRELHYDANRIALVNEALEKNVSISHLIEIIKEDYTPEELKEVLKFIE